MEAIAVYIVVVIIIAALLAWLNSIAPIDGGLKVILNFAIWAIAVLLIIVKLLGFI